MRTAEKDAWLNTALGLSLGQAAPGAPPGAPGGGMAPGGSAYDGGAEGAGPTGDPDAPPDPDTSEEQQSDPGPEIGPPSPPPYSDGRSRDDVLRIMRESHGLSDLALNLGLGPASTDALAQYLAAHGISPDDLKPAPPPQADDGNQYYKLGYAQGQKGGFPMCPKDASPEDETQYGLGFAEGKKHPAGAPPTPPAPSVRATPPGQEIIEREIAMLDSDSDPPRVRMAIVTGTKAQIDEVEAQAKLDIVNGMASGLLQGIAGIQEGRQNFAMAGEGAQLSMAGDMRAPNGAEIRIRR